MERVYTILVGENDRSDEQIAARTAALREMGMEQRAAWTNVRVFASLQTPTLPLPSGGLLIGEIYSKNGAPVYEASDLGLRSDGHDIVRRIFDEFWGDYVIALPDPGISGAVSVTRSPSHACAMECIYSFEDGKGFFTSDVTIATRLGICERRVDYAHLANSLIRSDLKTRSTGLADVSELLPGHTLSVSGMQTNLVSDWDPFAFVRPEVRVDDREDAISSVRRAVEMVVGAWAGQDRSVLLELSGGLDSSIVGACLRGTAARVACATVTSSSPGADECDYAQLVAALLGAETTAVEMDYDAAPFEFALPRQSVVPVIGALQNAVDVLMQRSATQAGATTYFSGAGGDTVFCYLPNAAPAADAFRSAGATAGFEAIQDLSTFHQCTFWKAARLTWRQLTQPRQAYVEEDRSLILAGLASPTAERNPWLDAPIDALAGDRLRIFGLSTALFYQQSCPRGLERNLRMPLLSQPVIEACLRVPSWMWFQGGHNRSIARAAFADVLPSRILLRKSKGSLSAFLGALYRRRRSEMLSFLLDGELTARGILDADALRAIRRQGSEQAGANFARVFRICAVENWVRQQSSAQSSL